MQVSVELSLVMCLALAAFAQSDRGTIIGTVADPTGAGIAALQARLFRDKSWFQIVGESRL